MPRDLPRHNFVNRRFSEFSLGSYFLVSLIFCESSRNSERMIGLTRSSDVKKRSVTRVVDHGPLSMYNTFDRDLRTAIVTCFACTRISNTLLLTSTSNCITARFPLFDNKTRVSEIIVRIQSSWKSGSTTGTKIEQSPVGGLASSAPLVFLVQ